MLRDFHLADLLTLANGSCGVAAVFGAINFVESSTDARLLCGAAALVPLALLFDVLDGRVARWRHQSSPLGRELDSLADLISFGVAPAAIAYAAGLRTPLDQVILTYFVICGLSRLARYNVTAEDLSRHTGKVDYFEGTPIPTSVFPLAAVLLLWHYDALGAVGGKVHLASALFFLSGSLMISRTLRIPKP
jgi:CDP-diacylglycerol--serine O-phosphatidyltransferase